VSFGLVCCVSGNPGKDASGDWAGEIGTMFCRELFPNIVDGDQLTLANRMSFS
jgi:hypothetical protein